jgi:hypothetical protein
MKRKKPSISQNQNTPSKKTLEEPSTEKEQQPTATVDDPHELAMQRFENIGHSIVTDLTDTFTRYEGMFDDKGKPTPAARALAMHVAEIIYKDYLAESDDWLSLDVLCGVEENYRNRPKHWSELKRQLAARAGKND